MESLPGNPMPEFALPTLTGERYSRLATDRFASPTLIVVLDPEGASPGSLSTPCARGVAQLPFAADIIWAFT